MGVRIDAESLPDDSNAGGFDTAGASLFFSSDQFEQYLDVAHEALDEALTFGPKPKVQTERQQSETQINSFVKKTTVCYREEVPEGTGLARNEKKKEAERIWFYRRERR